MDFLQYFQEDNQGELEKLFHALERLSHAHVAFNLFRYGVAYNKIQYWCRTMPRRQFQALLEYYHDRSRRVLEHTIGSALSPQQWT